MSLPGQKMGRPKVYQEGVRTQFSIEKELLDFLKAKCAEGEVTSSQVVNELLKRFKEDNFDFKVVTITKPGKLESEEEFEEELESEPEPKPNPQPEPPKRYMTAPEIYSMLDEIRTIAKKSHRLDYEEELEQEEPTQEEIEANIDKAMAEDPDLEIEEPIETGLSECQKMHPELRASLKKESDQPKPEKSAIDLINEEFERNQESVNELLDVPPRPED